MCPKQNGCHLENNIFNRIMLKKVLVIGYNLTKFYKGQIDNSPAFVQVMVWCWIVDISLFQTMMTEFTDA